MIDGSFVHQIIAEVTQLFSFAHALLSTIGNLSSGLSDSVFGSALAFAVQDGTAGTCDPCPASSFTSIGAAWANIGYFTQADILHWISFSQFGLWAPLLYLCAAIGGLVGVAINMPPRNYMWFFIGPAIYAWMIDSTQSVQGVKWQVAGVDQDQKIVWRDAEVGIANTNLAKRLNIEAYRDKEPSKEVDVAMPFLFVDELFSSQVQWLIGWTGVYTNKGRGGADTNLAENGNPDGPWFIMSNLKWGLVENITAAMARNPDVRDSLVTFLGSECGDKFKQSINTGAYISAAQARGAELPESVFIRKDTNEETDDFDEGDNGGTMETYQYPKDLLSTTWIPTPRALVRIFESGTGNGMFGQFSKAFENRKPQDNGRVVQINCAEYLWTVIQTLRWEAGHSYWQLVRTAPDGLTSEQFVKTLFYGWDIRKAEKDSYADNTRLQTFLRHLILLHVIRNELAFAPSVVDVKYAPSEQSRTLSDAYARTMGSKAKYGELYQWATMMPHIQGVLLYLLIIAYPFAAMMMVVPGWHRTFFTWMAFFAWVKLWDIGFAMVQVLERSVWAMIGNNSYFAKVASMVIDMEDYGTIGVSCQGGNGGAADFSSTTTLSKLCSVPSVCSHNSSGSLDCGSGAGEDQSWDNALGTLDRGILLGAGLDLDLSNAYYVYIMAALYFAVPAVTGQLVLGAKAGAASLVSGLISTQAQEAGRAAATGYSGMASAIGQTNSASLGQAAYMKALGKGGGNSLAAQHYGMANQALDMEREGSGLGIQGKYHGRAAEAAGLKGRSFDRAYQNLQHAAGFAAAAGNVPRTMIAGPATRGGTGGGTGGVGSQAAGALYNRVAAPVLGAAIKGVGFEIDSYSNQLNQAGIGQSVGASARAQNLEWGSLGQSMGARGMNIGSQRAQNSAQLEAEEAQWAARNAYSMSASSGLTILGLNPGQLNPGNKPTSGYMDGMASRGYLGAGVQSQASYAGSGFVMGSMAYGNAGAASYGGSGILQSFSGTDNMPRGYDAWSTFAKPAPSAAAGVEGAMQAIQTGTDWVNNGMSVAGGFLQQQGQARGDPGMQKVGQWFSGTTIPESVQSKTIMQGLQTPHAKTGPQFMGPNK